IGMVDAALERKRVDSPEPDPAPEAPAAPDTPEGPTPAKGDWKPLDKDMGPNHRQIVDPDSGTVLFDVEKHEGVWSVHAPTESAGVGTKFGSKREAMAWAKKYAHLRRDRKELPDAEGNFWPEDAPADAPRTPDAGAPEAPAAPARAADDVV